MAQRGDSDSAPRLLLAPALLAPALLAPAPRLLLARSRAAVAAAPPAPTAPTAPTAPIDLAGRRRPAAVPAECLPA